MDGNSILYWAFNISAVSADGNEDAVLGAAAIAAILSVFGIKSSKWIYGAWLGAMSHVLLDMLVHPEKQPLAPIMGNPFYEGWMQPTSLVLLPLAIWFIAQCALRVFGWARKLQIVNKELL